MSSSELTIVPFEYKGNRLDEIGIRVVRAFSPKFKGYKISPNVQYEDLKGLESKFLRTATTPYDVSISSNDFMQLFVSRQTRPALIITSLPVLLDGILMYGVARPFRSQAYLSTYRPEFGELDTDGYIEKVVTQALHELGHGFGLWHHEKKTPNGKLCPMKQLRLSDIESGKITPEEYIMSLDNSLCKSCYGYIKLVDWLQKF